MDKKLATLTISVFLNVIVIRTDVRIYQNKVANNLAVDITLFFSAVCVFLRRTALTCHLDIHSLLSVYLSFVHCGIEKHDQVKF